jgi:hypothetical protein
LVCRFAEKICQHAHGHNIQINFLQLFCHVRPAVAAQTKTGLVFGIAKPPYNPTTTEVHNAR